MENNTTPVETLFEKAKEFSKTTIELLKLDAIDKSAEVVSSIAERLAIIVVVVLFTIIINIGIALWISDLLGKSYYGFFVVGGFYALLGILLHAFRDQLIKTPVSNSIIHKMLEHKAA